LKNGEEQKMKKQKFLSKKKLVKTTALAISVAAILLISSAGAANVAVETSNNVKISEGISNTTPTNTLPRIKGDVKQFSDFAKSAEKSTISPIGRLIFEEGFEGGVMPPSGWSLDELNLVNPWVIIDAVTYPDWVHSGDYAAWINYDTANPSDNWLISPDINLTGYTDGVRFQFWIVTNTNWVAYATLEVYIDNGTGNSLLWNLNEETWPDFIYYGKTFNLDAYVDEVVNISFRYVGQDGNSLGLDDIILYEPLDDVGVVSIDSPVSGMATGAITPEVTVESFGPSDLVDVPVQLQIGYKTAAPGGYFFDFETDDGGWTTTADWSPYIGDWEWTNTYDVTNYVGAYDPPQTAYAGTGMWGTIIYNDYTNSGGTSTMWKVFDFSSMSAPTLSFYYWSDIFGDWDYGTVNVNGVEVFYVDDYPGAAWEYVEIDLSSYGGQSAVNISFDFYATTVVAYSGWYIDDMLIGSQMLVAEYDETELVDIDAGQTVSVTFPEWIPDAWHSVEDTDVSYDIWTQTQLVTDTNPDNDFLDDKILLHYGFYHDIATKVIKPESGDAGTLPVEVEVENLGQNPECCFNVNVSIEKEFTPVNFFGEDFEGYSPLVDIFPPTGWTIIQTGDRTWEKYLPTGVQQARCYEDPAAQDEWLITKTIDLSTASNVVMEIYRYMATPDDDYCEILGSINNGADWSILIQNYTAYSSATTETFDISSWADGQSQVKIGFRWVSTANGAGYDYFYFDDFQIKEVVETVGVREDFNNNWGPYGDNPPAGWTIEDFGTESPPAWNNNDFYNYSLSGHGGACRTYYTPSEDQDERIFTPSMNCSLMTGTFMEFYGYVYPSSYKTLHIEGSTDGGASWTQTIDTITSTLSSGTHTWDISSWADSQSQVSIRLRWNGTYGYSYMYFDDFFVGTRIVTSYINETFDEVIPESGFPPAGWTSTIISGTDPDNNWTGSDGTTTHPSGVSPHGGIAMAEYNSYSIPSGQMALLFTPSIDFSTYSDKIIRLHFWMNHDTGYTPPSDELWILYSTNGVNFYLEETFERNDGTTGWAEHTVDLTAYAAETTMYIGFLGVSDFGNSIYIDDIDVKAYGTGAEYFETQIILTVMLPGDTLTLTYPDWTPDDLALGNSATINYIVKSSSDLSTDGDTGNDQDLKSITLDFIHDVAVKEITEPSMQGDREDWVGYSNGVYANAIGSTVGLMINAIRLTPAELTPYDGQQITKVRFWHFDDGSAYTHDGNMIIYDAGTASTPGAILETTAFIGASGDGTVEFSLSSPVTIDASKDIWIGVQMDHSTAPQHHPQGLSAGGVTGKSWFFSTDGGTTWSDMTASYAYDAMIWAGVEAGGGPGAADVYLPTGSQSFAAIMKNLGTFPETGLTANAKLKAFNETGAPYTIYEENYTDFDLDVDEEELATFGSYNFVDSDIYELVIFLPLGTDEEPTDNVKKITIAIDGIAPTSEHTLDPANATGENGWYVGNVTVSLTADDGSEDWQSGLDHIEYKVDSGSWQTGDSVVVEEDGEHTVQYKAIDKVGNEETPNSVNFKIDQTAPTVKMTWESPDYKNVVFTATCSDATSGMDRVEFAMNDVVAFTDDAEPFEWIIEWSPSMVTIMFKATAYDVAGNSDFDQLHGSEAFPVPHSQTTTPATQKTNSL